MARADDKLQHKVWSTAADLEALSHDLLFLFRMRLLRFIDTKLQLHDDAPYQLQQIASSISTALHLRIRRLPAHNNNNHHTTVASSEKQQELPIEKTTPSFMLSTEQVRILLETASAVYSYDKAIRRLEHVLECGSDSFCATCTPTAAAHMHHHVSAAALHPSEAADLSRLHERIDYLVGICHDPQMKEVAAQIIPLLQPPPSPAPAENVDSEFEEEVACQLLLHSVADVVNYAEFDAVMEGRDNDEQLLTALLARIRLPDQQSEKRLRCWMRDITASPDVARLALLGESLPPLRQLPLPTTADHRSVRLSHAQIRRCLQRIADTIRLRKVVPLLQSAARVGRPPSDAIWMIMASELQFAVLVTDLFDDFCMSNRLLRHKERQPQEQQNVSDLLQMVARTADPNSWLRVGAQHHREEFLQRSKLIPPKALRLIDLEATSRQGVVCLVDYEHAHRSAGFSAVSHTFGMEVYKIFDCQCTATWGVSSDSSTVQPRWRVGACSHHETVSSEMKETRDRVVSDILRMCELLLEAGARYAWHDGVCIAQHDEVEVKETIERIGWVYAYASDTVIFLHYVGQPIGILRHGDLMSTEWPWDLDALVPRWQQRAWTLQEAALSQKRRYCVRVASSSLVVGVADCCSLDEFERTVEQWYNDETSRIVVMDEGDFVRMLIETYRALDRLYRRFSTELEAEYLRVGGNDSVDRVLLYPKICKEIKAKKWCSGLLDVETSFITYTLRFPTAADALMAVSCRASKHIGDRINGILALSGVTGFVAPKDDDMEGSTVEFFNRQGQKGLQTALYSINYETMDDAPGKRWTPCVWKSLAAPGPYLEKKRHLLYNVLGNNQQLEVVGKMVCVTVNFRITETAADNIGAPSENIDPAMAAARSKLAECATRLLLLLASMQTLDPALLFQARKDYDAAFRQQVILASADGASAAGNPFWTDYVNLHCRHFQQFHAASHSTVGDTLGNSELALHPRSVVERIGSEVETEIRMELRGITESHFKAVWPSDPGCSFGTLDSPYIVGRSKGGGEGGIFRARLMWPLAAAVAAESWPMLMVEGGDIRNGDDGAVEKVGIFHSSLLFRACIRRLLAAPPPAPPATDPTLLCNRLLIH